MNNIISYTKPCTNNGTWCSASTTCNYTFYGKDNSVQINNQGASSVGVNGSSLWEYNITQVETGLYKVDFICNDQVDAGANIETLYYQVTGDGFNSSLGFYILILAISFGVILLGFKLEDPWITILGTFGLYFVGIYILFNGIAGTKDAVTTWGVGIIVLAVAGYVSIKSAVETMS